MITFGSLFSGIGGLDLGLERAGMRCLWQVEIDNYANRVLERHWPNVPRYRDVRDVGASNLVPVDLICGGFPCQDVSLAGKRAGLDGQRSTLWGEFARIVRELRPRWVLAENVPGLLSANDGRFFGRVLRDLAESGYDAEWDVLSAAAVGAPHRRERVAILAYPHGERRQQITRSTLGYEGTHEGRAAQDDYQSASHGEGYRTGPVADPISKRHEEPGAARCPLCSETDEIRQADRHLSFGWWELEPNVGRVAHGVPARVDRLRCLGNAVVPQWAEYWGRLIVEADNPSPTSP